MTNFEGSCGLCWHKGLSCFCHTFRYISISHKYTNAPYSNKHKRTKTYKHTNMHTLPLQPTVGIWQVLWIQVDSPYKKGLVVFVIFLLPPYTVNMTLSPSLLANGRQLGSSELVISHCPLCPVKRSTEFCMLILPICATYRDFEVTNIRRQDQSK